VGEFEQRFTDALVRMGVPRMIGRVITCLTTTDSGSMTSAELVERLGVSPASISKAIAFLEDQQLVRRERDGRRERYVVDDVWYRATLASGHTNAVFAQTALEGAKILGPDTPAGARLADTGRFLKCFGEDRLRRAEYWHAVITGGTPQDNASRAAAEAPRQE
jgi:DNA-binding transcriptional ArsR family regulator